KPNTKYTPVNFGAARSIQMQDASGAKISNIVTASTFTTPAGCYKIQFNAKLSTDSVMIAGIGIVEGESASPQKKVTSKEGFQLVANALANNASIDGKRIVAEPDLIVLNNYVTKVRSSNLFDKDS